ncbi:hypothetical protein RI367_001807 [Sorochytrium milnesiophthora]
MSSLPSTLPIPFSRSQQVTGAEPDLTDVDTRTSWSSPQITGAISLSSFQSSTTKLSTLAPRSTASDSGNFPSTAPPQSRSDKTPQAPPSSSPPGQPTVVPAPPEHGGDSSSTSSSTTTTTTTTSTFINPVAATPVAGALPVNATKSSSSAITTPTLPALAQPQQDHDVDSTARRVSHDRDHQDGSGSSSNSSNDGSSSSSPDLASQPTGDTSQPGPSPHAMIVGAFSVSVVMVGSLVLVFKNRSSNQQWNVQHVLAQLDSMSEQDAARLQLPNKVLKQLREATLTKQTTTAARADCSGSCSNGDNMQQMFEMSLQRLGRNADHAGTQSRSVGPSRPTSMADSGVSESDQSSYRQYLFWNAWQRVRRDMFSLMRSNSAGTMSSEGTRSSSQETDQEQQSRPSFDADSDVVVFAMHDGAPEDNSELFDDAEVARSRTLGHTTGSDTEAESFGPHVIPLSVFATGELVRAPWLERYYRAQQPYDMSVPRRRSSSVSNTSTEVSVGREVCDGEGNVIRAPVFRFAQPPAGAGLVATGFAQNTPAPGAWRRRRRSSFGDSVESARWSSRWSLPKQSLELPSSATAERLDDYEGQDDAAVLNDRDTEPGSLARSRPVSQLSAFSSDTAFHLDEYRAQLAEYHNNASSTAVVNDSSSPQHASVTDEAFSTASSTLTRRKSSLIAISIDPLSQSATGPSFKPIHVDDEDDDAYIGSDGFCSPASLADFGLADEDAQPSPRFPPAALTRRDMDTLPPLVRRDLSTSRIPARH